jgi:invasion protein IalB
MSNKILMGCKIMMMIIMKWLFVCSLYEGGGDKHECALSNNIIKSLVNENITQKVEVRERDRERF